MVTRQEYLAAEWFLMAISFLVVAFRVYARATNRKETRWWSEGCLILAVFYFLALAIGDTYTTVTERDPYSTYYNDSYARWTYASVLIFDTSYYLPRFSLLMFYYSLFPRTEEILWICLNLSTAFTICGFLTTFFVDLFWCGIDVSQNWAKDSDCAVLRTLTPSFIIWPLSITSEILVFVLPFGMLPTLKTLPRREKNGLIFLFLLGAGTVIVSAARFRLAVQQNNSYGTYIMAWLEMAVQIIIGSVPALRQLLRTVSAKWRPVA